jgi:hypothetical protein
MKHFSAKRPLMIGIAILFILAISVPQYSPVVADGNIYNLYIPVVVRSAVCTNDYPSIVFTYVPPIGSFENVKGKVCGVNYQDHRVVLLIYAWHSWWVKPYSSDPTTDIASDGTWTTDYTTGGVDETATIIKAILVPANVDFNTDDLSTYLTVIFYR